MKDFYRKIFSCLRLHSSMAFAIAGILIGASFISPLMWWYAFPGVILFFFTLEQAHSIRAAIFGSLLTGCIKAGIAVSWLFNAYPADWLLGATRTQQIIVIGGCWFGTALSVSFGYVCIGIMVHHVKNIDARVRPIIYSLLFVLGEIIGSISFSLYTYGTGGSINSYFGFSQLGFTVAYHGLLKYAAAAAGVYGLTFILVFCACTILHYARKQNDIRTSITLAALATLIYMLSGFISLPARQHSETTIAAIATTFPSEASMTLSVLNERQRELIQGTEEALVAGASTIVLAEDARMGYGINEQQLLLSLREVVHSAHAVVVDSYRTDITPTSVVLRGYIYDIDAGTTYTTDKRYVVPMGEYLPYLHGKVVSFLDGAFFFDAMRYRQGSRELSAEVPTYIPNVLFCFESGAATLAKKKSDAHISALIAHPVSHGWFHTPKTLWNQERQMLIVQAMYSGTPILQAGNNAPSELYTEMGDVEQGKIIGIGVQHKTLLFNL